MRLGSLCCMLKLVAALTQKGSGRTQIEQDQSQMRKTTIFREIRGRTYGAFALRAKPYQPILVLLASAWPADFVSGRVELQKPGHKG